MIKILTIAAMTPDEKTGYIMRTDLFMARRLQKKATAEIEQKIAAEVRKDAIARLIEAKELPADFVDKI